MITIFQLINDSKQSTKSTNEIRTFSNKMMQKSTRCLARHPSSNLKNLEMAVLILELEFDSMPGHAQYSGMYLKCQMFLIFVFLYTFQIPSILDGM